MSRVLPVAVVQAAPHVATAPIGEFAAAMRRVVATFPQTKLVACPELHLCGTTGTAEEKTRRLHAAAEPLDGPRATALSALAAELGVWLVPGSVCERGADGELFNTAVAYAPDGRMAARYRKVFPWRPYEPYDPGDRFVVFDIPGLGRVGLAICYDLWFPEVARSLAWMGAELIVCPTQTTTCDREQELVLARAAAIHNQVYVLSVNTAGPVGTGRSLLVDPEGIVRVQAPGAAPTVLTDVLDLDAVSRVRTYGTCGLNRMWGQPREGDAPIALPVYGGSIDPARWTPTSRPDTPGSTDG